MIPVGQRDSKAALSLLADRFLTSTRPDHPVVGRRNEYQRKLGRKQAHSAMQ